MPFDLDRDGKPLSCCEEYRLWCFRRARPELTQPEEPVTEHEEADDASR
jgi:hypothetical protein